MRESQGWSQTTDLPNSPSESSRDEHRNSSVTLSLSYMALPTRYYFTKSVTSTFTHYPPYELLLERGLDRNKSRPCERLLFVGRHRVQESCLQSSIDYGVSASAPLAISSACFMSIMRSSKQICFLDTGPLCDVSS